MFNYRVLICIGTNTGGGVRSRKSLFESFRFHAFSFLSFLLAFVLATIIFYRAPTADRSVSSSVNATILQPLYNDRVYTGEECVYIYARVCVCMCAQGSFRCRVKSISLFPLTCNYGAYKRTNRPCSWSVCKGVVYYGSRWNIELNRVLIVVCRDGYTNGQGKSRLRSDSPVDYSYPSKCQTCCLFPCYGF